MLWPWPWETKSKEEVFILDHSFKACFHSYSCEKTESSWQKEYMEESSWQPVSREVDSIGLWLSDNFWRAAVMIYFIQEDHYLHSTVNYEPINGLTHWYWYYPMIQPVSENILYPHPCKFLILRFCYGSWVRE